MATRMQQRRGTAAQWTAANPVLAAGEIGFETDTSKFKMGNGSSNWAALTYFANTTALEALLNDGAPATLNTLNEIAAAINDDPNFFTSTASSISSSMNTHNVTTNIHGIANTTLLATLANVATAKTEGETFTGTAVTNHSNDITQVHGIDDTSVLATATTVATAVGNAITTHSADTSDVHGIANTALLATLTNVSTAATNAATALTDHEADTSVHGIPNTLVLVTQTQLTNAVNGATVDQASLAGVGIDYNSIDARFDIDSTIATKTYADNAVSTHQSDTTSVHGIVDTSLLATLANVAAVTKTTIGLGSVDNTADTAKPVSTSQASAIATAKAEAIADATAQVTALVTGAPAAMNTLDELAAALGDDENFAASVTTSLGLKVDSLTPISQKTASYTLSLLTERDDLIEMGSASALVLTIPTDATLNYPIGTSIDILQTGAGQVTVAPVSGTVTVNATPGLKLRTTWSSATLFKRAANTWVVFGDLTA